jgi:small subunit ribosomal protein S1
MENPVVVENNSTLEFKPKMKVTGTVLKTSLAGAVIDIGTSKPAVIHVSQLITPNNQPIKSVKDVLQEGQQLEVWIRKMKDERIELTMVKPLDLEWRDIKKDMAVKGTVVRIETFGVFLDIGAERPGLIHISELAHGYVRTPADVVQEGDELEAQVIEVNKKKKQIKLSLKALQPEPVHEELERPVPTESKKEKPRKPKRTTRRQKGDEYNENIDNLAISGEGNPAEAEPTAMEIAMREAMDRAKSRKQEDKIKKAKSEPSERDDIIARTLEHKSSTSGQE